MKYSSFFSLFLLSFTFLPAQNETSNSIWVQAGLGFVSANFPDSDGGLNGNASLNYRTDYGIFSFNYFSADPILGEEYINTYSLQYGRSYDFKMRGLIFPLPIFLLIKKEFNYSLITRAGISYNIWNKRGEVKETFFIFDKYNYELKKGIGFPLEVELKQDITSYLGMGIGFYANFSPVKGYSGASLNLYIGSF